MLQLVKAIPDPELLLALSPEELAAKMLFLMRSRDGGLHCGNMENELWGMGGQPGYPSKYAERISLAFTEAWAWLEAQGLLVPRSGSSGQNGWRRLSRRAQRLESESDFASFQVARLLPQELLHPSIAKPVWLAFMRGEYDVAAFLAMKAVEVSVREAAGFSAEKIGVKLMRAAFSPEDGPLMDTESEAGERQGRMDLFAGAIASYKNKYSHRDEDLKEPGEAIEIIMLANHLLRIVDARRDVRA